MYKIGLVLGKFMPIHRGHIALIDFAKANCDLLFVAVCYTKGEPISGQQRLSWVNKVYENDKKVVVSYIDEDLPDAPQSDREVSKVWAEYLKSRFSIVDIIFGSEKYVEYVAEYMDIEAKIFDEPRNTVPISATMIRQDPHKYRNMIPDVVKPYFVKKVCIYGADSCGKSTLTERLAKHYKTAFVPELARNLIDWGDLNIDDLQLIHLEQFAKMQYEAVMSMQYFANRVLFCDSDNLTTQIYSSVYCGEITEGIKKYEYTDYDLYLLLDIDTPYFEEGQRNLGHRRQEMFNRFKAELDSRGIPYVLIDGNWEERFEKAKKEVDKLLSESV